MLFFFRYHSYRELSNFPHISIPFPFGLAISIDILIDYLSWQIFVKKNYKFCHQNPFRKRRKAPH